MCRLLGYAAAGQTTPHELIGPQQLAAFAALSRVHGDGWGTSWSANGTVANRRYARSAADDAEFVRQTRAIPAQSRIVHLRWATPGHAVALDNTHPFQHAGISFAHNGTITPGTSIEELLRGDYRTGLRGTTDSERYFALVRQELNATHEPDLATAVARAAGALRTRHPLASLNALLLSAHELIVVHANSPRATPLAQLHALPGGAPHDHVAAYFTMRWRRAADGSLVFVSTGLDAMGWSPMPEESVTSVDLRSLTMRSRALDKGASGNAA